MGLRSCIIDMFSILVFGNGLGWSMGWGRGGLCIFIKIRIYYNTLFFFFTPHVGSVWVVKF